MKTIYGAILMRPAYEEQVRAFAEQYLPSEGIKIYTEIKNGGSGAAEEEAILNEVSAVTYIFMDDALCSEQYEVVSGGCAGLADGELSGRAGRESICARQSLKRGNRLADLIMRISSGKISIPKRRSARYPGAGK